MSAVSEKCKHCFLYQNAQEIENLYPKEEAGVVVRKPVRALPQQCPRHEADSVQKFPENKMWLIPHPLYSPDLKACNFFIFPELKLALKGQDLGDLEGMKLITATYIWSILKSDFKRCYDD